MMTLSKTKYLTLSAVVLLMAAPVAASAQLAAPLSGLYACEGVTDKDAQLSCFLTETAKLRAAETSDDVIAVEKDRFEEIKEEEVKKAEIKKEKAAKTKPPKRRSLAIRSATLTGKGYYRFTLENGEVWQQIESGRIKLGTETPDMLVIKRASFGSFLARVNGKGSSVRVRQVGP